MTCANDSGTYNFLDLICRVCMFPAIDKSGGITVRSGALIETILQLD